MRKFTWSLFGLLFLAGAGAQNQFIGQLSELERDGKGRVFLGSVSSVKNVSESNAPAFIKEMLGAGFSLVVKSTERDQLGFTHIKYEIEKEGVLLVNKRIIAHFRNGLLTTLNGDLEVADQFEGNFTVSESQALASAVQKVGATTYMWEKAADEQMMKKLLNNPEFTYQPHGEKVYLEKENKMVAAWKFTVFASEPLYRANVYVDASSGAVIEEENLLCGVNVPGSAVTKYSGTQNITVDQNGPSSYRLRQTTSGGGVSTFNLNYGTNYSSATDFTNNTSSWTTTGPDQGAADAHWGAERTHAYYLNQHSRNSLDNAGFPLLNYVHYSSGFMNAFWDGSRMTYGDGNGSSWRIFASLDVCGHEITHGLTENTAGLVYQNEPGALNESFSDIFGASIENFARPTNWNWKIGEDITSSGIGLRNMQNPNNFGDPDTYMGLNWYSGTGDNGGVHTNSGVPNFWYYLLVMGGSGTNDLSNTYAVQGLGFTAASKIAFRALTVYFTPTTDFKAARAACLQAAKDLYGDCSNEMVQTVNAWAAVGVGAKMSATSVMPNFSAKAVNFCNVPATVSFSNTTPYSQSFVWNFGDGSTSTAANPIHTYTAGGSYNVRLQASACNLTDSITKASYVVVDIPQPPSVTSTSACYGTSASLFANASGYIQWYDSPTSTVNLQSGIWLSIPTLTTDQTFYVNNTYTFGTASGGILSPTGGSTITNSSQYLIFDVLQPGTLNSVVVAATSAITRTIELRNSINNLINSKVVALAVGFNTLTLDFALTPGSNYRLGLSSNANANIYRTNSGVSYPYNVGNCVSITGSSAGAGAYYWFYHWKVTRASCVSAMAPVAANVLPLPNVNAGVTSEVVCAGDMVPVTVSPPGGLLTGAGAIGTGFQAMTAGAYTITYTYFDHNQCMNASSLVMHAQECTGIEDVAPGVINIYPNPAHTFVTIGGLGNGMAVRVCDLSGRQLLEAATIAGESKIDLSAYEEGVYVLSVISSEGQVVSSQRIIRQ